MPKAVKKEEVFVIEWIIIQLSSRPRVVTHEWTAPHNETLINLKSAGNNWDQIGRFFNVHATTYARRHRKLVKRDTVWTMEMEGKLEGTYQRCRSEMWSKIANEMGLP
jgi:hypothetical protein